MGKKSEAFLIWKRGGKLLEVRIIPHSKNNQTNFSTDKRVAGKMETKSLEKYNSLIEWLDQSGKLSEVEEMIKTIIR